jgi:hypothetical protein
LDATDSDDTDPDPEWFRNTCDRRRTNKAKPIIPATATITVDATTLDCCFVSEERLLLDPLTAEISLLLVGLDVGGGTAGDAAAGLEELEELAELAFESSTGPAKGLLEDEVMIVFCNDGTDEGSVGRADGDEVTVTVVTTGIKVGDEAVLFMEKEKSSMDMDPSMLLPMT